MFLNYPVLHLQLESQEICESTEVSELFILQVCVCRLLGNPIILIPVFWWAFFSGRRGRILHNLGLAVGGCPLLKSPLSATTEFLLTPALLFPSLGLGYRHYGNHNLGRDVYGQGLLVPFIQRLSRKRSSAQRVCRPVGGASGSHRSRGKSRAH